MKSSKSLFFALFLSVFISNQNNGFSQVLNGPWIDTLWQKTIYGPTWPSNFQRFNLDGMQGPTPWGSNAWEIYSYPLPSDTSLRISSPPIFPQVRKFNRWFILPPIQIGQKAYDFIWKSKAGSAVTIGNGGYNVWVCENCPPINSGNIENYFVNNVSNIEHEIGQNIPGPYFYQTRTTSLNAFRGKSIRIAFQISDSGLTSVGFKEFTIRSLPVHDLAVNSILLPSYSCNLKPNEKVRVAIQNRGGVGAAGFSLSLFLNGNLLETKNYPGTLPYDAPDTLDFLNVNMANPGNYHFRAVLSYASDSVPINDTLSRFYFHTPPANLNLNGWKEDFTNLNMNLSRIIDKNKDGTTWGWIRPQASPYSFETQDKHRQYLIYYNNVVFNSNTGNDWFIGGCLRLEKDSVYQFDLKWSSFDYSSSRRVRAWLGNQPEPDSLQTLLLNVVNGSGVHSNEKASFTATRSGNYFVGIQTQDSPQFAKTVLREIRMYKKYTYDLALLSVYQPSDSGYTCPGQGQGVTLKVRNDGRAEFPFPTFRVEADGPGGPQSFEYTYPGNLAAGALVNLFIPANLNFSGIGKYNIRVLQGSFFDQEAVNDTTSTVFYTFPPKPASFVENFFGASDYSYNLPDTWWSKANTVMVLSNGLSRMFAGSGGIKQDLEAVSPPFTGLGSASNFVCDVNFEGASGTNNFLAVGDTLEFLVSVNCGPFVSRRRFLPGRQMPVGWQPVYIDMDTLNITPSDWVYLKIKATHTAQFVGLDYRVSYRKIRIEQVASFDAQVRNPVWYPYSQVPFRHKVSFVPAFSSANGGMNILSPLTNTCSIQPAGYNQTINNNIGINVASAQNLSFPAFEPLEKDTFLLRYQTATASFQTDGIPENNQAENTFIVGDSTLARDYGPSRKRLGFTGTNSRGMIGQVFTLLQPDTLTGISFYIDTLTATTRVKPVVYLCNATTGIPVNFPLDTNWAQVTIGTASAQTWRFVNLRRPADQNRGLALPAGKFFLGLIQKQQFMALGSSPVTAEKRTTYRRNSAATGNAWTLVDTVGQVFVRAHLGKRILVGNQQLLSSSNSKNWNLYPNPAENEIWVERKQYKASETCIILNSMGQKVLSTQLSSPTTRIDISSLPKGIYRIRTSDGSISFIK